jgi:pyruvate/2-oxoglutarate dehydrogenase complex dihydrolipoamide acyltransferase (E2) component
MKLEPLTGNRQFIYELLNRAKTYHCSISAVYEYDLTDTLARIDEQTAAGKEISLTSFLVKATATVVSRHPRFNAHLFHRGGRQYVADFGQVSCSLVVKRLSAAGEEILFPVLVRDPEKRTIADIFREIKHFKEERLDQLPQMASFAKIKQMRWWAFKYFSYKARSDPEFYLKYFGTYGLSSVVSNGWGALAGNGYANTAAGFVPATLRDKPTVVDGAIRVRRMLTLGLVADHYLLDGADILRAMSDLRTLLETDALLG